MSTCLIYVHPGRGIWTFIGGELFLPAVWFSESYAAKHQRIGLPTEWEFASKPELGLRMIRRVKAAGVPFERVACDALYGRHRTFRATLDAEGIAYAAQVPANTLVYEQAPQVAGPEQQPPGPCPPGLQVLSQTQPRTVRALAEDQHTT